MILVVGGLNGFVGSNTTETLVNLGQECVVTRHKDTDVPQFLQKHIDNHHVHVEPADATSIDDLRRIGEKHKIDGIVNVAGGFKTLKPKGPLPGLRGYFNMLEATFRLAEEWKVKRITFSSTGGMYIGLSGVADEAQPIHLHSPTPMVPGILQYQKIVEVASSEFTKATGISSICVRLMGMYGPFQDPEQGSLVLRLVHSAVTGEPPDLDGVFFGHADDAVDLLYIKDLARAIGLLQTAEKLQYNVYNIGSGKPTSNHELVEEIKRAVPNFTVNLPAGRFPFPPLPVMETKRLLADTGFSPNFNIRSAIQDYVGWLRAGNPK